MTIADPDKGKPSAFLLVVVIIVFTIGIIYSISSPDSIVQEHNASDDAFQLLSSFQSLAVGDIQGFFDYFIDGLPLLALFLVVLSILHFLLSTTLGHIFDNSKLVTVMAVVLSVYAFVNQTIYTKLLSLNGFSIAALVFGAVVIMLWSFGKQSADNISDEWSALSKKRELSKADREKLRELIKQSK